MRRKPWRHPPWRSFSATNHTDSWFFIFTVRFDRRLTLWIGETRLTVSETFYPVQVA